MCETYWAGGTVHGVSIATWLSSPLQLPTACKRPCSRNRMLTHRSGMFWWPSQTGLSTALSGSCSADRSPHLSEKHPFLVAVGLLPALPHLLIPLSPTNTIRFGIFLFDCLKKKNVLELLEGNLAVLLCFLEMASCFMTRTIWQQGFFQASPPVSPHSAFCVLVLVVFGNYVGLFPQVVDSAIGKIRLWCKTHCHEYKHAWYCYFDW